MEAYKAIPELPWASSQGGVIILKGRELTFQNIVDGNILFKTLNSYGQEVNCGVAQYHDNEYYVNCPETGLVWQVEKFTGVSNRITLHGNTSPTTIPDKLIGIVFVIDTNPELPWKTSEGSLTINLNEPITDAELDAGAIEIYARNLEGQPVSPVKLTLYAGSSIVYQYDNSGETENIVSLDRPETSAGSKVLVALGGDGGWEVTSIKRVSV